MYLVPPSKSVLVVVTYRNCSYSCSHCFCEPGPDKGNFEIAREIALQAYKLGYDVYFYASEADQNCFKVYRSIGQNLKNCSICIREDPATKFLDELNFHEGRVGISLHGATKESHEFIAGPNSFEKVIQTIKKVRRVYQDAEINVWCAVNKKNMYEIRELVALTHELKVDYLNLMKLGWLGRARKLPNDIFLTQNDILGVIKTVEEICEKGIYPNPHITLISTWGITNPQAEKFVNDKKSVYYRTEQYCPAGRQHFTVDSLSKKIWPCHHLAADEKFSIGHWTEKGLLIESPIYQNFIEKVEEPCKGCEILKPCGGGCRAEAIAEHMRLTGEYNPYVGLKNCRKILQKNLVTR